MDNANENAIYDKFMNYKFFKKNSYVIACRKGFVVL